MALKVNPKKHDALWCLGNVHTQQGFMVREASEANKYFDKANALFQRALDEVGPFHKAHPQISDARCLTVLDSSLTT